MRALAILALNLVLLAMIGIASLPTIHTWERNAGYPWGKMCNSAFTFYVDTCRR
jgi:hypothetical protein